jgi:hypothetical protein
MSRKMVLTTGSKRATNVKRRRGVFGILILITFVNDFLKITINEYHGVKNGNG